MTIDVSALCAGFPKELGKPVLISAERSLSHEVELSIEEAMTAIRQAVGAPDTARVYIEPDYDWRADRKVYVNWSSDQTDIRAEIEGVRE